MLKTDYSIYYPVYGGVVNQMAEAINDLAANGGGGGGGAVASVNGKVGIVVLEFKDIATEDGAVANSSLMLVDTANPDDATKTTYVGPQQVFVTDQTANLAAILKAGELTFSGGTPYNTKVYQAGVVVSDSNPAGMVSRLINSSLAWDWAGGDNGATITPDTNVAGYVDLTLPAKSGVLAVDTGVNFVTTFNTAMAGPE